MLTCIVRKCPKISEYIVDVGGMKMPTCDEHHAPIFELRQKFRNEFTMIETKYYNLAMNLKVETQNGTINPGTHSKPQNSEGN